MRSVFPMYVGVILDSGYYQDPAFISTGRKIYDPDDVFRIVILKSKTGRDISSVRADETEILFPRNTKFKVIKYYYGDDGTPTIEVIEVEK